MRFVINLVQDSCFLGSFNYGHTPLFESSAACNFSNLEVLKTDDVSEEELEAIRLEAAYKMKMTGGMAAEATAISRHLESRPTSKRSALSQDGAR